MQDSQKVNQNSIEKLQNNGTGSVQDKMDNDGPSNTSPFNEQYMSCSPRNIDISNLSLNPSSKTKNTDELPENKIVDSKVNVIQYNWQAEMTTIKER